MDQFITIGKLYNFYSITLIYPLESENGSIVLVQKYKRKKKLKEANNKKKKKNPKEQFKINKNKHKILYKYTTLDSLPLPSPLSSFTNTTPFYPPPQ